LFGVNFSDIQYSHVFNNQFNSCTGLSTNIFISNRWSCDHFRRNHRLYIEFNHLYSKKNLRKNPCSIYFIAYNLANVTYVYSSLLGLTLDIGYKIDFNGYNLSICRLYLCIVLLSNCLSPFYLILASIDRISVTSLNALTRQRSTRRLA